MRETAIERAGRKKKLPDWPRFRVSRVFLLAWAGRTFHSGEPLVTSNDTRPS